MRTITEREAVEILRGHFGLETPVAFEEVKKQYHRRSIQLHPDKGGDEEGFKLLSAAYENICNFYRAGSSLFVEEKEMFDDLFPAYAERTTDGRLLSELGQGLGPTTNGRPCDACEGNGYRRSQFPMTSPCEDCRATGSVPKEYLCRFCKNGKFQQRRSRRIVDCRVCAGTGVFRHPRHRQYCSPCEGTGRKIQSMRGGRAVTCYKCEGSGEIWIENPVLQKGALGL